MVKTDDLIGSLSCGAYGIEQGLPVDLIGFFSIPPGDISCFDDEFYPDLIIGLSTQKNPATFIGVAAPSMSQQAMIMLLVDHKVHGPVSYSSSDIFSVQRFGFVLVANTLDNRPSIREQCEFVAVDFGFEHKRVVSDRA